LVKAPRDGVDGPGHQFLPCPAFADDQHGARDDGHAVEAFQHLSNLWRLSHQPRPLPIVLAQPEVLLAQVTISIDERERAADLSVMRGDLPVAPREAS
jgi:hypothetical protein